MIIKGTYNLQVDTAWRNVQEQDVYLECDTTDAPVIINLFPIADLNRFWGVRLFISDISNNAGTNNIIINAGGIGDPIVYDTIDEEGNNQITLNTNGESVAMKVVFGTSWLATESKTPATPNLQQVTDSGNSTDQDIQLEDEASFILSNSSKITRGSKDNYAIGGGISQVCSLEKELQWENGVQYYFEQGQPIIHANSINDNIPDSKYDQSKSFQVGSTYTVLNTGLTYICTDDTIDNAVWELKSISLQEILDYNHDLTDGNNFQGTSAGKNNVGTNVNAFGESAGQENITNDVNFFGFNAGKSNSGGNVNAFGNSSALGNTAKSVNAFGLNAGRNNLGENSTFIGENAGYDSGTDTGNSLPNAFVISNLELPTYADFATASTAITVLNGAVAGNNYLYHDRATNSIGVVRL